MLIEGVKLSNGQVVPLSVDDLGRLILGGEVEFKNDSGNPIPITGSLSAVPGLSIPSHDGIEMTYTGDDLTGVVYKSGEDTVATLTLGYTDGKLTSVVRV
jgi:hypothetical protein